MRENPAAFWTFSLSVYSDPEVSETCLTLQDAWGTDVNVVLFVLWHGCAGRRLDPSQAKKVDAYVGSWRRDVVQPLRSVRRALKHLPTGWQGDQSQALRNRVKACELEAERLQHEAMEAAFPLGEIGVVDTAEAAAPANLRAYAQVLGVTLPEGLVDNFCAAVRAARRSG